MAAPLIKQNTLYLGGDVPIENWLPAFADHRANEIYIDASKFPADRLMDIAITARQAIARSGRSIVEPVVLGPITDGAQIELFYRRQLRTTDLSFNGYCAEIERDRKRDSSSHNTRL